MEECGEWGVWVTDIFIPLINPKYGNFQLLPFRGALMDQPYTTMQILRVIYGVYVEFLKEINK